MTWTAPMTAVAGSVFTAAQFNTFIRDNLGETAPAKATTPGSFFVTSATNQIVERVPNIATAAGSDTTTGTSYTDLDGGPGPSLTITTGVNALVVISTSLQNTGTGSVRMGYDISGSTTRAASDGRACATFGVAALGGYIGLSVLETGLTPGSNTFLAKYRVASGTGTFNNRRMQVVPF